VRRSSVQNPSVTISALSQRNPMHSINIADVTATHGINAHLISAAFGFLYGC
jgi:hypothetical protein